MTANLTPPPLDAERHALFLDFDGTFVDFPPAPDAIRLRPESVELLERVGRRLGGALAVISDRRIADLDRFLSPLELPASGLHGLEFRAAPGNFRSNPPSPQLGCRCGRRIWREGRSRGKPAQHAACPTSPPCMVGLARSPELTCLVGSVFTAVLTVRSSSRLKQRTETQ